MTEGIYFVEIPTALQRTSGRKQTTAGDSLNDLIINFVHVISFFSIYTTLFSNRINCQDLCVLTLRAAASAANVIDRYVPTL